MTWTFAKKQSKEFIYARSSVKAGEVETFKLRGYETADPRFLFNPAVSLQVSGKSRISRPTQGSYEVAGLVDISPPSGLQHVELTEDATSTCLEDLEYICITPIHWREWIDFRVLTASDEITPCARQWIVHVAGTGPLDNPQDFSAGGRVVLLPGDVAVVFTLLPMPQDMLFHGERVLIEEHMQRLGVNIPVAEPRHPNDIAKAAR